MFNKKKSKNMIGTDWRLNTDVSQAEGPKNYFYSTVVLLNLYLMWTQGSSWMNQGNAGIQKRLEYICLSSFHQDCG